MAHFTTPGSHFWGSAAAGIMFFSGGKVLLLLRSSEVNEPGTWGISGGALHAGDKTFEGAVRETVEELGTLPEHEVFGDVKFHGRGGFVFTTFLARVAPEVAATWEPDLNWENDDAQWFPVDELPEGDLHFGVEHVRRERPDLFVATRRNSDDSADEARRFSAAIKEAFGIDFPAPQSNPRLRRNKADIQRGRRVVTPDGQDWEVRANEFMFPPPPIQPGEVRPVRELTPEETARRRYYLDVRAIPWVRDPEQWYDFERDRPKQLVGAYRVIFEILGGALTTPRLDEWRENRAKIFVTDVGHFLGYRPATARETEAFLEKAAEVWPDEFGGGASSIARNPRRNETFVGWRGPSKFGQSCAIYGKGTYFAFSPEEASVFTNDPRPYAIELKNPLRITTRAMDSKIRELAWEATGVYIGYPHPTTEEAEWALRHWIEGQGHDGVIVTEREDRPVGHPMRTPPGGRQYVVFSHDAYRPIDDVRSP